MIKAVIIDDVQQARETLKEDLGTYCPDVSVIGEAEGVVSGAKILRNLDPDVVFLDIQMNDGSGFDLLEILGNLSFKVIFTTASDAHAIRAFRFSAIDYLMKPIDPDELVEAVKKVGEAPSESGEHVDLLLDTIKEEKRPTRIALNTLEKIHIAVITDIIRCESSGNYTIFYFRGGRQLLVTKTLKEFDNLLKDHRFIRVHQSHLINAQEVREFVKIDGGYIVMTDGTSVPVSSRKRSMVMEVLQNL